MPKRPFTNRLNDLEAKSWLKFQKSWFIHNPPPRVKDVLRHPAKFPETLAQEFIEFFTKRGQVVLDPMLGTGSTVIAALRAGRNSYGIELNPIYADIARQLILAERELSDNAGQLVSEVIAGDAAQIYNHVSEHRIPPIDYVLTSPPYWNMLHAHGAATQKKRRTSPDLDVYYSAEPADLGKSRLL
jgi:DNA modification methylase